MKVKAKRWINVGGNWYSVGDVLEVETLAGIGNAVEVVAEPKPVAESEQPEKKPETVKKAEKPEAEQEKADEPVKSSVRRRKTTK